MATKATLPRIRKILVVDDEVGFAELMRDLLQDSGYEVQTAKNGVDGIAKLATFQPDAIISDILMPELDGFEMFKQIKSTPKTSNIPFLFISGFQDSQVLDKARKIGIFGILRKPIDIDQIERRLRELLR